MLSVTSRLLRICGLGRADIKVVDHDVENLNWSLRGGGRVCCCNGPEILNSRLLAETHGCLDHAELRCGSKIGNLRPSLKVNDAVSVWRLLVQDTRAIIGAESELSRTASVHFGSGSLPVEDDP